MAADLNTVIKQLTESSIIAQGKLENFVPPKAQPKTVDELVAQLVKESHLTQFQATQVKAGKAKALILGEYTILDKIGAGGMGQVFKAQHRRMKRVVAIKMLPPAMTKDAAAIARFEREVEAAAKLRHPNIVAADDAGQVGTAHFLVMEYVDGRDLSAMVKRDGPLPVNKAVNYILQTARGLEFAHKKGVVHRDIKPANLLLDSEGVVKILDMGLARIEQADGGVQSELTGTGTIMGTVDYMSPEQALNTRDADQRADIYSLGMSLYYLLAGKAAYSGETAMQKLMAHQNQPIPSLQDVQTTVPKQLDAVFKKMVAKKIENRYQTMSEVIEALEGLGYGGSGTMNRGDIASTIDLSSADRKKLIKAKKQPLGSITEVVASEKTKYFFAKVIGGSFGTIVAPILVFYLIRHLEKEDKPAVPPAATAPAASVQPVTVAANTTTQPPAHVVDDGSPKPLVAPFDIKQAHAGQAAWAKHLETKVETINSVGMRMTLIPPGEFLMGSTPEQNAIGRKIGEDDMLKPDDAYFGRLAGEMPQHKVTISQPFLMGSTEVTVAQFRKFVEATKYVTDAEKHRIGNSGDKAIEKFKEDDQGKTWKNPGYAITDDTAVTQITWNDADAYCAWLSEQEQLRPWYRPDGKGGWLVAAHADGYRLPTEAEWEYACRAGTTTQYSFGDDKAQLEQYGWFKKNADSKANLVALKRTNAFGLFDMHGNAQEWCQDRYEDKWYEKSLPSDPVGPNSGNLRLIRGGYWSSNASLCRSASRNSSSPSYRGNFIGFRCVRVWANAANDSQLATNTTTQPTTPVTPAAPQRNQPWNTPAYQQWVKATQALPAEKQVEAVSKKLMELNPGFDGKLTGGDGKGTPKIQNGVVIEFGFITDNVTDISPVPVLRGLNRLWCYGNSSGKSRLADLAPLQGMALESLSIINMPVAGLSSLIGMPLKKLYFQNTLVSDISPLQGMKLTHLVCNGTPVSDLSPLNGMPLVSLSCENTQVADLSRLRDCKNLGFLLVRQTKVTPAQVTALQKALPNCKIEWDDPSKPVAGSGEQAVKPWETPAFQQWVKATQALPAEQQIEAVSKKLMELNPGFDGTVTGYESNKPPKIQNGVVTEFGFFTDDVSDISPVRAFSELKVLRCNGSSPQNRGKLSDLSPLEGMKLLLLYCSSTSISDLSPLRGSSIDTLLCGHSEVFDLTPLERLPLMKLTCEKTRVTDFSPLQNCTRLRILKISEAQITPEGIAPLQKALPNCKISWDDPAKPKTPEPAAAGKK